MEITGIKAGHLTAGKISSKKGWKLTDSLREKITEYAREDAAQNVYMGNKFLALRKSEVAKVAPNRAALMGKLNQYTADMKEIIPGWKSRAGLARGHRKDIHKSTTEENQ